HRIVPQRRLDQAQGGGVIAFRELCDALQRPPANAELQVLPPDDPGVSERAFKTLLPLYTLEAAAGRFGEGRTVEIEGWVDAEGVGRLTEDMFVARAIGRSMEPRIIDGDYLVFRARPAGSRQGKIVLARGPIVDPDIGGP